MGVGEHSGPQHHRTDSFQLVPGRDGAGAMRPDSSSKAKRSMVSGWKTTSALERLADRVHPDHQLGDHVQDRLGRMGGRRTSSADSVTDQSLTQPPLAGSQAPRGEAGRSPWLLRADVERLTT